MKKTAQEAFYKFSETMQQGNTLNEFLQAIESDEKNRQDDYTDSRTDPQNQNTFARPTTYYRDSDANVTTEEPYDTVSPLPQPYTTSPY